MEKRYKDPILNIANYINWLKNYSTEYTNFFIPTKEEWFEIEKWVNDNILYFTKKLETIKNNRGNYKDEFEKIEQELSMFAENCQYLSQYSSNEPIRIFFRKEKDYYEIDRKAMIFEFENHITTFYCLNIIREQVENIINDSKIEVLPNETIKTKSEILKEYLIQFGFFEIEKVSLLSEQSKILLIDKIFEKGLPYAIAMFDFLQFIEYLKKNHLESMFKLNKEISKWFNCEKSGRTVKGNINSLSKKTNENKFRYTAYKHKENVIKDYELLK